MSLNTVNFIAKRYVFSKKEKKIINIISIISVVAVAVVTAALIIILSVFNGLEDFIKKQYNSFNPELKIMPKLGKTFIYDETLTKKLKNIKNIAIISDILEDDAVFRYGDAQMIGKIKGVSDNFPLQSEIALTVLRGEFDLNRDGYPRAMLGRGVAGVLSINPNSVQPIEIWYPERKKKITLSESDINKKNIQLGGIYEIEFDHDSKYMIVPLAFAQELMEYSTERTALEIKTNNILDILATQKALEQALGENFVVQTREEQQQNVLRAIKIEKLFAYLAFVVILAVASMNISFVLTMLAIDKRTDVALLLTMGIEKSQIKQIFLRVGALIALSGAILGLVLGGGICFAQQQFGMVSMGMVSSMIEAYPVKMELLDFVFVGVAILVVTLGMAYFPARKASETELREHL